MGEPVGKVSGRTFSAKEHYVPDPLLEFTLGDVIPFP